MNVALRVAALVCFVLAAASALLAGVNLNEAGLVAAGLAGWVASTLVD